MHEGSGSARGIAVAEQERIRAIPMSLSPASKTRPNDATLEQTLRDAVQNVYKSGNLENLTVRRIRKSVEDDLNLEEDFFKTDDTWTSKSKLVIQAEVVRVDYRW